MKQYFETDALPLLRLHYSLEKTVIFLCKLLHLTIHSKEPAPIKRVREGAFCLAAANLNEQFPFSPCHLTVQVRAH